MDFDKRNNNPTNVRRLTREAHLKEHQQHAAKTLQRKDVLAKLRALRRSPAYRERIRRAMLQPAMRAVLRLRARRQWADPAYKQFMAERYLDFYKHSPEHQRTTKRRLNQAQQEYWSQEEHRARQATRVRKFHRAHPEVRQQLAAQAKLQWRNAALRRWRSEKTQQQWTEAFRRRRKQAYGQP